MDSLAWEGHCPAVHCTAAASLSSLVAPQALPSPPSLHVLRLGPPDGAMFFQGSVAEAIAASRREMKPLIVLLTGLHRVLIEDRAVPGCLLPACRKVPCTWHERWPVPVSSQGSTRAAGRCRTPCSSRQGRSTPRAPLCWRWRCAAPPPPSLPAAAACKGVPRRALCLGASNSTPNCLRQSICALPSAS